MFLIASIVTFAIFFVNVALGAMGNGAFLGDIGEMILLFAASVLFVVAILQKEAAGTKP